MRLESILISADLFYIVIFLCMSVEDCKTYKLISENLPLPEIIYSSYSTRERKFSYGPRLIIRVL
jgi:hypothetical protein